MMLRGNDPRVPVTLFPDYAAKQCQQVWVTHDELAEQIAHESADSKEELWLLKLATVGDKPSPAGSLRYDGNVITSDGIEIDYDAEEVSFDAAVAALKEEGLEAVVHTSPSHRLNGHGERFRLLLWFTKPRPPVERARYVERIAGLPVFRKKTANGDITVIGAESWNISQSYHYGRINGNPPPRVVVLYGRRIDDPVFDRLDATALGRPGGNGGNGAAHEPGADREPHQPNPDKEAPIGDIIAALNVIPNDFTDWHRWVELGLAVYAASGGSDEGYFAFEDWSRRNPNYDDNETVERWQRFQRSPPTRSGYGSLVHWARQYDPDFVPPSAREAPDEDDDTAGDGNSDRQSNNDDDEEDEEDEKLEIVRPHLIFGREVPSQRWLVPNWIPWGRVTGYYGEGGEGKTTTLQQLLGSTSLARTWLGLEVRQCRSMGVFCECDLEEVERRQQCINDYFGHGLDDLRDTIWLPRYGKDNLLMVFTRKGRGELTPLWHLVREQALDEKVGFIALDALADTFGGNENDRGQVRQYANYGLGGLARATGGPVVVCAHPSLTGINTGTGTSGSTGWDAAFRSRIWLTRPDVLEGQEPDIFIRLLHRKKANYAPRDETIELKWIDGVFDATGVSSSKQRSCERVFLDLLRAMLSEGRALSTNNRVGNYAPKIFAKRPNNGGFKQGRFERAMEVLFATSVIGLDPDHVSKYRHKTERIIPTGKTFMWDEGDLDDC